MLTPVRHQCDQWHRAQIMMAGILLNAIAINTALIPTVANPLSTLHHALAWLNPCLQHPINNRPTVTSGGDVRLLKDSVFAS